MLSHPISGRTRTIGLVYEAFEITTVRMLADSCNDLLVGLDDHRAYVSQRVKAAASRPNILAVLINAIIPRDIRAAFCVMAINQVASKLVNRLAS